MPPRGVSPREPLSPSKRLSASAYHLRAVADGSPDDAMVDLAPNNNNNYYSSNKKKFRRQMKSGRRSSNGKNAINHQRDAEAQVAHDDLYANALGKFTSFQLRSGGKPTAGPVTNGVVKFDTSCYFIIFYRVDYCPKRPVSNGVCPKNLCKKRSKSGV